MKKEKYFAIAFDWGDEYPEYKGLLGFHMTGSSEIFRCTKKQAKLLLKNITELRSNKDTNYFLVELKVKRVSCQSD